ncbi:uncharacterized protein LOC116181827 [Photinus pyralis]|uniref:uncharacterized protein LOC116181827 n=1 Tax=Photinus pyralis TaxID=7054 RepID=UPI0012674066|nr:uncharacterized protein LOC116181827 [Photinus pyralis]
MQEGSSEASSYCTSKSSVGLSECNQKFSAREFLLPPVHVPTRKEREIWSVKALPSDWDSAPKGSQIIEKLNAKRKERHEAVQSEVLKRCQQIDLDLEMQIRQRAELFKLELHKNNNAVLEVISRLESEVDTPNKFEDDEFEVIKSMSEESYDKNKTALEEFYAFLQGIEKERSKRYKEVLKYEYGELFNISYLLPRELQIYFEHKLLNFNQMILNNLRCYLDIHLNLHNKISNTYKFHNHQITKIYISRKCEKKVDALIKLNQTKLWGSDCENETLATEQGKQASTTILNKQHEMNEMISHLSDMPISSTNGKRWISNAQEAFNSLDIAAKKLISLYKVAVAEVFNGYFEELQDICAQMSGAYDSDTDIINMLNMEVCKPSIESLTKQYTSNVRNIEVQWELVTTKLRNILQITYTFLRLSSGIWDRHFDRVNELRNIILKEVHAQVQSNDKWQNNCEIELTMVLDTLRQAPSESKLNVALTEVFKKLDILANNYKEHYVTEIKIVEKYENLTLIEANLLIAELGEILYQFPKEASQRSREVSAYSELKKDATPKEEDGEDGDEKEMVNSTFTNFIVQRMKQCEYQVGAVQNWMYGLQEGIELFKVSCKEDSGKHAQVWISDAKKKLAKRLEVKLEIHNTKYERIKCGIYEVRLAELKIHNERLSGHIAGAEKQIMDIKASFTNLEKECEVIINDYKQNVATLHLKIKQANCSNKAKAGIQNLHYCSSNCHEKLKCAMKPLDDMYNTQMAKIKLSSIQFSKAIRLFSEDGNYHSDEVKTVTQELKKLEKTVKAQLKRVKKEIQVKQKKMTAQVKAEVAKILPFITMSLEELQFKDINMTVNQNLQIDLKKETFNLKFYLKKAEDNLRDLESFKTKPFDVANLKEYETGFQALGNGLLQLMSYLYQSEPINNVRNINYSMLPVEITDTTDDKKSVKKDKKTKKEKAVVVTNRFDYTKMLFEHEPQGNCFMSKLCKFLQDSLKNVQQDAKEFYDKHVKIINSESVPPSYDKLMVEVLEKYNCYHQQCELLWFNMVYELLDLLESTHVMFVEFSSNLLKHHHKNRIESLQESYRKLWEQTEAIRNTNIETVRSVRKKLKPLYGYDDNRHMLDSLQNEMVKALTEIRNFNVQESVFVPFQEYQNDNLDVYRNECEIINGTLKFLNDEYVSKLLKSPLICQFEAKIRHLNEFLTHIRQQEPTDLSNIDGGVKLALPFQDFSVPPEFEIILEKVKLLQNQMVEGAFGEPDDYIEVTVP